MPQPLSAVAQKHGGGYWFSIEKCDSGLASKSSGTPNLPTPGGVRRYQTRECRITPNGQNLSLGGPAGLSHSLFWIWWTASNQFWGIFWARLLPAPKNVKTSKLAQIHHNLNKSYLGHLLLLLWLLFGSIWISIFDQFSWPLKSLKLQSIMRQSSFF